MLTFNQLKLHKKPKRLWHNLKSFIWGGYKRGGLVGLYHWFRCHIWNRYHIINISGEEQYDWGWIDTDNAMLLACFKLLKEYVEKENPEIGLRTIEHYKDPNRDWYDDWERVMAERELEFGTEVRALYNYWTVTRPKEWAEYEKDCDYNILERIEAKEDEMLLRLMKVRGGLWT